MSQIRAFFCSPWESTPNPCNPARTHIAPLSSRVQSAGLAPGPRPRRPLPGGPGRARSAAPPPGAPPRPPQAGAGGSERTERFHPLRGEALEKGEKQGRSGQSFSHARSRSVLPGFTPLFQLSTLWPLLLFHSLGSVRTFDVRLCSNALRGLTHLMPHGD